ncbi:MAG: hypothetical protein QM719_10560 [Thermomonas sp.]
MSTTEKLVERQLSPLDAVQVLRRLRELGATDALGLHDPTAEKLLIRTPAKAGPDGRYGLLLFIDPRPKARLDAQLNNVLDTSGLIWISPDNAGDDADELGRRIPLALLAYEYARRTYDLDPDRIYLAGSAGGSRVAQRLLFTYPDLFTGVIVNSGAAELGTRALPVPAGALLERLRTHSQMAFATSSHDQPAFSEQQRALKSLRAYCVPVARVFDNGHTVAGHAPLTPVLLFDALKAFEAPRATGSDKTCAQTLQQGALAELARIRQMDAGGDRAGALNALVDFDHAYGRLLPDEEIALARQLKPEFFGTPAEPGTQAAH